MASEKLTGENFKNKRVSRLSERPIDSQTVLYAHIARAGPEDPMRRISITDEGDRVKSDFRRAGRPRTKLYNTTRKHVAQKLTTEGVLPENATRRMSKNEIDTVIMQASNDRII